MVRMKSEAEIEETAVQSRNKENKATHSLKLHFCTQADVTETLPCLWLTPNGAMVGMLGAKLLFRGTFHIRAMA